MAGGSNSGHGRGQMIDSINVTPLVDIMLVLLLVVMVAANFAASSAVPMDLPAASESDQVQTMFAVTLPEDEPTRVDGEQIPTDQLEARAAEALEKKPDLRAVIQADGDVPHRRVMQTMDALRAAGLTKVAFATSPDSGANEGDESTNEE